MSLFRKQLLAALLLMTSHAYSQCDVAIGPPPPNAFFNTGSDGSSGVLPAGSKDRNWTVAMDVITGTYAPAVVMGTVPSTYHKGDWPNAYWVSFNETGGHPGSTFFFFKIEFDLPCKNLCGKNYKDNNTFCLGLDLFADNSIYEIYINGKPQSGNLGNVIPVNNPYHYDGVKLENRLPVSLCKDWKEGKNTLIIQVASSATVMAFLAQAAIAPLPPIEKETSAVICEGQSYSFGSKSLTKTGYYLDTFKTAGGCDSVEAVRLTVHPKVYDTVSQTICEGQDFEGYTKNGTYTDVFTAGTGCDSVRTLHLTVLKKPAPDFGTHSGICGGDSVVLSPGKFDSYLWQDGSTDSIFVARVTGTYRVTVTNSCGTNTAQVSIPEKDCGIYFPSAFTPNKDGRNDVFKVLTSYVFQEYYLSVYNRWGQKVFETRDAAKGWDGTLQKQLQQPQETFVWQCTFTRNNIITHMKGTVVLIR
jgi:gliding motility-associated-like protein